MGIASIIGLDDLISEIGKTARQIIPDPQGKRDFQIKLEELRDRASERIHQEVLGQLEVNKAEAQHESIFVAGWRPAVGWCCAIGLLWNFLFNPILLAFGLSGAALPIESLITLVVTMLGASSIRTFERVKGIGENGQQQFIPAPLVQAKDDATLVVNTTPPTAADNNVPTDGDAPWNAKK